MRILQSYYRWLPKVFPKKLKILKYTYRRVRKSSQEILHSLGAFISFLICNILYITSYLVILLHICIASLQPTGAAKGSNDFAPEVNQSFPPPPDFIESWQTPPQCLFKMQTYSSSLEYCNTSVCTVYIIPLWSHPLKTEQGSTAGITSSNSDPVCRAVCFNVCKTSKALMTHHIFKIIGCVGNTCKQGRMSFDWERAEVCKDLRSVLQKSRFPICSLLTDIFYSS